jgi:hypothetical protein
MLHHFVSVVNSGTDCQKPSSKGGSCLLDLDAAAIATGYDRDQGQGRWGCAHSTLDSWVTSYISSLGRPRTVHVLGDSIVGILADYTRMRETLFVMFLGVG